MARSKIDYGIDLGTTNSAIAYMKDGTPVIVKVDSSHEILPSCVSFNQKKSIYVGERAWNALRLDKLNAMKKFGSGVTNTFIEFKRTMGTDKKYLSSYMDCEYTSEELSAEILKTLKSYVVDEVLKSIVITVPAKFTINQKDATANAAKLAGFQHCELLIEPIAASMAYGLDTKNKQGIWLVFDFGGGTFDAALLKVEEGIMKVVDTEGDNYLGGKNIDYAIVDEIIIPYLKNKFAISSILSNELKKEVLREAMKFYAEEAKIQLSFRDSHNILPALGEIPGEDDEGNEFELDITVTRADLEIVVKPFFLKAIELCKELLTRNNLAGSNLSALILVGGPTYSPILRRMLKEQITDKVDTSIDPMTCVAEGAALFASTINISEGVLAQTRDKKKIQLSLGYVSPTVREKEFVAIKVLKEKTEGALPSKILAEIVRGADKAWSSGKIAIDEKGEVIDVALIESKANAFNVYIYDEKGELLPCEPNEFIIIQGSKIGNAILSYHIGIAINNRATGRAVFKPAKGLERNQSYPAKGVVNGLKTQKNIRNGVKEDFIKISIYEGEHEAEGSRAIYNNYVADIFITGEDLPSLLPEGSDVDITISVDRSGQLSLSAFFPTIEHTHDVEKIRVITDVIDSVWLESEIKKAEQNLTLIGDYHDKETLKKLIADIEDIHKRFDQGKGDDDRKFQVLGNLRKCQRKLDEIQDATEWPKTESELKDSFYNLEDKYKQFEGKLEGLNEDLIKDAIKQFKEQIPRIIKEENIKLARELTGEIRGLGFVIEENGRGAQYYIDLLNDFNRQFDILDWEDNKDKARSLINQGLQAAQTSPTIQKLKPIAIELFKLLPSWDNKIGFVDESLLTD